MFSMAEKKEKKTKLPFNFKCKIKLDAKKKKVLIVSLIVLALGLLFFNFKHLFFVATVNNKPITRLALNRELERQGGKQILESLITKSLILQEAKERKLEVSKEEIEAKISEFEIQLGAQDSTLEVFLETQGQTRESLGEQIEIQLTIERMFAEKIDVSEEELLNYFEENKTFFAEDTAFEEVKSDLENNLRQEKVGELFQAWLEEAKQNSEIRYFLEF